jgi:hypothetical protein
MQKPHPKQLESTDARSPVVSPTSNKKKPDQTA